MTYVVTDACIKCKYMDCVEVCPVDCFYEGETMLVLVRIAVENASSARNSCHSSCRDNH